jgi:hypothetical protein
MEQIITVIKDSKKTKPMKKIILTVLLSNRHNVKSDSAIGFVPFDFSYPEDIYLYTVNGIEIGVMGS